MTIMAVKSTVTEEVEEALPDGDVYQLPEEWRLALASLDVRKESPTSISTFLTCPLKWWLDRYSPLPDSREVSMPGVVGTFVHRVLEVFYSEPAHLRSAALLDITFKTAWDALKTANEEDGIVPPELIAEFRMLEEQAEDADAMRGGFYNKARAAIENILEFDLEPSEIRVVANEMWVRTEVNGVQIRGKIDRIQRTNDGGEDIEDYKTGRPYGAESKPDVLDPLFVPVGMYAWMRTRMTEDDLSPAQVKRVRLLYLSHLRRVNVKITPKVIEKVDLLIRRVVEMMDHIVLTGEIMATPAESAQDNPCRWCPAQNICPAWTDGTFTTMRRELEI